MGELGQEVVAERTFRTHNKPSTLLKERNKEEYEIICQAVTFRALSQSTSRVAMAQEERLAEVKLGHFGKSTTDDPSDIICAPLANQLQSHHTMGDFP